MPPCSTPRLPPPPALPPWPLTPIPPVQVFGLFVALGVLIAWVWTVTFIPAYIMLIPPASLARFGLAPAKESRPLLARLLAWSGRRVFRWARPVLLATAVVAVVAAYGISRIAINDNPVKWFAPSHPIRIADRVLNAHFGGTYMAYLALEALPEQEALPQYTAALSARLAAQARALPAAAEVFAAVQARAMQLAATAASPLALLEALEAFVDAQAWRAPEAQVEAWEAAAHLLSQERQRRQVFKQPEVLRYVARLQEHLLSTGVVGKSSSLADIVKTVHRELFLGEAAQFRIPDSASAVAQTLLTYQSSHRPQDLWHFVTPDYRTASLWVQLKSGDNQDMSRVVAAVDRFFAAQPPPMPLRHRWFGLTYLNVVWQQKMVSGMLQAFLGSFLVVLLMMVFLFRSALWGLLSMVPLTVTIGLIYGAIGFLGKDYDMPVAVLSSLSLGLAVDYAIHFLARSRALYVRHGTWAPTLEAVFGEPARAIARNAVVVSLGFLPLLAAPLVPYQTVGTLIAAILLVAGLATLLVLPALATVLQPWLFPATPRLRFTCQCATCLVTAVAAVALGGGQRAPVSRRGLDSPELGERRGPSPAGSGLRPAGATRKMRRDP
ncbi:MAG: hypothetical protein KatS3mg131_1407 [Candidatus Tectimicrobiota bacterium]|nr:MAG: hypothetical protein KatS3mg131_1407 [Candidatus Tectomicrobia bacterium]